MATHLDQQSLIDIIAGMGIDFISTVQQSTFNFTAKSSSNSSVNYLEEEIWGIGYYLLHNNKEGYFCHNDFSRSTAGLVDIANQLIEGDTSYDNDNASLEPNRVSIDISDSGPWTNNMEEEAMVLMNDIVSLLTDSDVIDRYNILLEGQEEKRSIQNSKGANITQVYQQGKLTIELDNPHQSESSQVLVFGGIQKSDLEFEMIIRQLMNQINVIDKMENADRITPGTYPVLLSPDSTYSLIHESIGHGCEADQIISGKSFLTDKLGHKVASSELTITDDPHLRNTGWAEYDDEGTKTKGTLLVEDGILTDYLHTSKTAKILDSPNTGNARTNSYLHKPEPRQSNLFIEPKALSVEEMLESISEGVYIGPSHVASTSIYTGNVYIESQFGRKIENGELTDYLLPITLSGNALDILSRVVGVGSELEKFPTECLKAQSKLDIGAYAPYLQLEDVYLQ